MDSGGGFGLAIRSWLIRLIPKLTLLIWTNSLINYYLFVFCFVLFFYYKSVKLNVFIVITKKLLIGASETAFLGSLSCGAIKSWAGRCLVLFCSLFWLFFSFS